MIFIFEVTLKIGGLVDDYNYPRDYAVKVKSDDYDSAVKVVKQIINESKYDFNIIEVIPDIRQ